MIYIDCPQCSKSNLVHGVENIYSGLTFICAKCKEPFVIDIHHRDMEQIEIVYQGHIIEEEKK